MFIIGFWVTYILDAYLSPDEVAEISENAGDVQRLLVVVANI